MTQEQARLALAEALWQWRYDTGSLETVVRAVEQIAILTAQAYSR